MVFDDTLKEKISTQWRMLDDARARCSNAWQESWDEPAAAIGAAYQRAQKGGSPSQWREICDMAVTLRTAMSETDGHETIYFVELVKLSDLIENGLAKARANPDKLIAHWELRRVSKSIDAVQQQIQGEKEHTPPSQSGKLRRLNDSAREFEKSKRQINILSGNSFTIKVSLEGLVEGIGEIVKAIDRGVRLLKDESIAAPLKRTADKVWKITKTFVRVTKQRFIALRAPWGEPGNGVAASEGAWLIFDDNAPEPLRAPHDDAPYTPPKPKQTPPPRQTATPSPAPAAQSPKLEPSGSWPPRPEWTAPRAVRPNPKPTVTEQRWQQPPATYGQVKHDAPRRQSILNMPVISNRMAAEVEVKVSTEAATEAVLHYLYAKRTDKRP